MPQESADSPTPIDALNAHLLAESEKGARQSDFDMNDQPELEAVLDPFPKLKSALQAIQEILVPNFKVADKQAIRHQSRHKRNAKITSSMGALAVVAACALLGFTDHSKVPPAIVYAELFAVVFCLAIIIIGMGAATQPQWLISRNVAERFRHLKFHALSRNDLWCGSFDEWKGWLQKEVDRLNGVSQQRELADWVADEPLPDPPPSLASCSTEEAAALQSYFKRKRILYQQSFFDNRFKKHSSHKNKLHKLPGFFFWLSIGAVMLHFILELVAVWPVHDKHDELIIAARCFIVLAAALPAVGAGVRTWLLAFEYGRSALLYKSQKSCLKNRLEALDSEDPDAIFNTIWFTEITLEAEHRAWIRLMLDAEWFG